MFLWVYSRQLFWNAFRFQSFNMMNPLSLLFLILLFKLNTALSRATYSGACLLLVRWYSPWVLTVSFCHTDEPMRTEFQSSTYLLFPIYTGFPAEPAIMIWVDLCLPRLGICGRHPSIEIAAPAKQGSPHHW
jgi:hypothetical protein